MSADMDELKRLCAAATKGEWLPFFDPGNPKGFQHCVKLKGELGTWVCDCLDNADQIVEGGVAGERNAAFIAAANPAVVADLIDQLQKALVEAERYRFLRNQTRGLYDKDGIPTFVLPHVGYVPGVDIMRGSVAGHLDTAIDTQISLRNDIRRAAIAAKEP